MTSATGVLCPQCQHVESSPTASFCSRCGSALRGPPCPACGAPTAAGDEYCTQCGAALRPARSSLSASGARVPWAVAGILGLALTTTLILRSGGGRQVTLSPPPASSGGGAGSAPTALGPTSAVDIWSMTPREAANRLFNRVMTAVEAGNEAEAAQFLPMAIAAHDRIATLSLDDRFHLSLLHAAAGDAASSLAVAEAGLAVRPTHLLCLAAAADAALLLGDEERAASYYRAFLDAYDSELAADLPEYAPRALGGHGEELPNRRAAAMAYLASR